MTATNTQLAHIGRLRYPCANGTRYTTMVTETDIGLRIGVEHVLDRTQVVDLIAKLQQWVDDGYLPA
jgi:hypothetical protein